MVQNVLPKSTFSLIWLTLVNLCSCQWVMEWLHYSKMCSLYKTFLHMFLVLVIFHNNFKESHYIVHFSRCQMFKLVKFDENSIWGLTPVVVRVRTAELFWSTPSLNPLLVLVCAFPIFGVLKWLTVRKAEEVFIFVAIINVESCLEKPLTELSLQLYSTGARGYVHDVNFVIRRNCAHNPVSLIRIFSVQRKRLAAELEKQTHDGCAPTPKSEQMTEKFTS